MDMDLIKETDLPGIGKKFAVTPKKGGEIIIIVHDDGMREIYQYDEDDDARHIISFDDNEARKIGGILGGMAYTPRALETMQMSLSDLTIDWHKIAADAFIFGKTIGDLGIRKNTGVSIIAIIGKDGRSIVNPGPESALDTGDTLVLAGTREQIKSFKVFASHSVQ
jgi:TrkA domain protein